MTATSFPPDLPDNLQGLARLGRDSDLDMRPVLLRVLTDLYVSRAHHGQDEINQFEAIALGLLDKTDAETRVIVARKLAGCHATPLALAGSLVDGGGPPAAAILSGSTILPRTLLLRAALGADPELAAAVATRLDLDIDLCELLAARSEIEVTRALANNFAAPLDHRAFRALAARAATDRELGAALCARAPSTADLAPLFLHATGVQRAAIILAARRAGLGEHSGPEPGEIERATAAEIERAALARDPSLLAAIVARALGCDLAAARALTQDSHGEAVALTLRALHVAPDMAARIFMCLGPEIAHNVDRVRLLAGLVDDMPLAAATRIVRAIVNREAPRQRQDRVPPQDNREASTPSRPRDTARPSRKPGGLLFVKRTA